MSKSLSIRNAEDEVEAVADLLGYSKRAPAVRAALKIVLHMPDDIRSEVMSRLKDLPDFDRPDKTVSVLSVLSVHGQDFVSTKQAAQYLSDKTGKNFYPKKIRRLIEAKKLVGKKLIDEEKAHYMVSKASLEKLVLELNRPHVTQA